MGSLRPPSSRPRVVHATTRTHESFFSFSLPPSSTRFHHPRPARYFFFSSTVFEPLNRTPACVSLSKSGEGNADDEWQSEEEMKVACRPGIYIFPRVTRLMIRLYAVARTRASRHFFQSGRRCWEMQQRFFYFLPLRSISREDEGGGIEEVRK